MLTKYVVRMLQALCWRVIDHDREHCYDRRHSGDELCEGCKHE